MPQEAPAYTLQELSDVADVTPRTVRYYIAQGLLPSPGQAGPGTRYGETHLERLRLIKKLQRAHLPLAEIRSRLAQLDDRQIAALAAAPPAPSPEDSAIDYIRTVLSEPAPRTVARPPAPRAAFAGVPFEAVAQARGPGEGRPAPPETAERSQWERIALAPDIELHIRRPLTRQQNRRVDRLIAIARELLEEDEP